MAVAKSAEAFRTISEAAAELDVPQHVLRHWEEVFGQIRPMRRAGGRRYYRPVDLDVLRGVRVLLYDERYTTKGAQKIFKENGVKYVAEIGRLAAAGKPIELRSSLTEIDATTDKEAEDLAASDQASAAQTRASPASRVAADSTANADAVSEPSVSLDKLEALLSRLEKVQAALDETTLALEAIELTAKDTEEDA